MIFLYIYITITFTIFSVLGFYTEDGLELDDDAWVSGYLAGFLWPIFLTTAFPIVTGMIIKKAYRLIQTKVRS